MPVNPSTRKKVAKQKKAKIALIADEDLSFGLSRMYEMMSDDF